MWCQISIRLDRGRVQCGGGWFVFLLIGLLINCLHDLQINDDVTAKTVGGLTEVKGKRAWERPRERER